MSITVKAKFYTYSAVSITLKAITGCTICVEFSVDSDAHCTIDLHVCVEFSFDSDIHCAIHV